MQSKKMSIIETISSVLSGFIVAWALTMFVLPLWDIKVSVQGSLEITCLYTSVSLVRVYLFRRVFNKIKETV